MAQLNSQEQVELMREKLESEQQRKGFDINEPLEPIGYSSGAGSAVGAIVRTVIFTALFAAAVYLVNAANSGNSLGLFDRLVELVGGLF